MRINPLKALSWLKSMKLIRPLLNDTIPPKCCSDEIALEGKSMIDELEAKGFENTRLTNVSSIDTVNVNINEEERIDYITSIAVITKGLTQVKPERKVPLYNDLLKEGAGETANRIFEFLPVVLKDVSFEGLSLIFDGGILSVESTLNILKYSFYDTRSNNIYTNMRCLLKAGIPYENIPYNTSEDLKEFKVIDLYVPMFVWAQLYTHTQISKISESDRVSKNAVWSTSTIELPENFIDKVCSCILDSVMFKYKYNKSKTTGTVPSDVEYAMYKFYEKLIACGFNTQPNIGKIKHVLIEHMSAIEVFNLFKELGFKKEICSRAIYYMRMKRSIFAAWNVDPNTWCNLINERTNGWTQKETKDVAFQIKELIK